MKKYLIVAATLALLALASCGGRGRQVDASGTFEATEVIVSSEANGRLLRFDVMEGDSVRAGATLGQVDTVQLYYTRKQLVASIRMIESRTQDVPQQLASTLEQLATQNRERARAENLLAANVGNQKQLDDINSAIAVLQKQLDAQRTLLENANQGVRDNISMVLAQIAQIDDQLDKCRLASPVTGTVLAKYAEQGEVTAVGRPLLKVADLGAMFLRAYITSDQLSRLRLGQKVTVTADYGERQSKDYEGTITWISGQAEFTPKNIQTRNERANLVYAVKIAVVNDGFLKIGMYGDVRF